MRQLDLTLIFGLLAAFLLSVGGFISGDSTAGWCGIALLILFGTTNIIKLLHDIREVLRRRRYGLGYG